MVDDGKNDEDIDENNNNDDNGDGDGVYVVKVTKNDTEEDLCEKLEKILNFYVEDKENVGFVTKSLQNILLEKKREKDNEGDDDSNDGNSDSDHMLDENSERDHMLGGRRQGAKRKVKRDRKINGDKRNVVMNRNNCGNCGKMRAYVDSWVCERGGRERLVCVGDECGVNLNIYMKERKGNVIYGCENMIKPEINCENAMCGNCYDKKERFMVASNQKETRKRRKVVK